MKVALGADHGGYQLKSLLKAYLREKGHEVVDLGTSSDEAVDYPRFALAVARWVAEGRCEKGIMIDGAGIGSAMAANKVSGVRAALAYDLSTARNSREHNDANVLTLGAHLIGPGLAKQIVDLWLGTDCVEERHQRRVSMIVAIEQGGQPGSLSPEGLSPAGPPIGAPPAVSVPAKGLPHDLSDGDLERIAQKLQILLAGNGVQGPTVSQSPDMARRFIKLGAGRLSAAPSPGPVPADVAKYIDHTILRPDAAEADIVTLCAEAREFGFASVCVNPVWVRTAARELAGAEVDVCSVVGFPLGATPPEIKAFEARRAIREGAREIDMVINIGALKGGDDDAVLRDVRAVVEACRDGSAICKVIIEAALLNDEEKARACRISRKARAHFVKTSTGFGPGGASAQDVALMAEAVRGAGMEVKAAGGIKSYGDARRMIEAGATRIGASAGIAIVREAREVTVSA
jgi:deoxyribose-phosphate aldolase